MMQMFNLALKPVIAVLLFSGILSKSRMLISVYICLSLCFPSSFSSDLFLLCSVLTLSRLLRRPNLYTQDLFKPAKVNANHFNLVVGLFSPKCCSKPALSYHPRGQKACVQYFDHFCEFISVNVQASNQLLFMSFLSFLVAASGATLAQCIILFIQEIKYFKRIAIVFIQNPKLLINFVQLLINVPVFISALTQLTVQIYRLRFTLPSIYQDDLMMIQSDLKQDKAFLSIIQNELIPIQSAEKGGQIFGPNGEVVDAKILNKKEGLDIITEITRKCGILEKIQWLRTLQ
ncbi:Palmitoyltransferase [Hexamita inflata]|uniref:Palmitoyltransferase n=1 Tax=Hexamita inflata TaxID=28002 RepID=A0ABP1GWU0_9EUKA